MGRYHLHGGTGRLVAVALMALAHQTVPVSLSTFMISVKVKAKGQGNAAPALSAKNGMGYQGASRQNRFNPARYVR